MPKLYTRNKKTGKRTFIKKRSINARQTTMIKKNAKAIKSLKKLDEIKFLDHITVDTIIDKDAGNFYDMNALGPWDSASVTANDDRIRQREGNKVTTRSITVKGSLIMPYNLLTLDRNMTPSRARIMFIQVFEQDPTNPSPLTVKDFLVHPGGPTAGGGLTYVDGLYLRNRTKKLKILSDKTYTLEPHYWNYSNAQLPGTNTQFSGLSATRPNQINIRTTIYAKKMYNKGVIEWAQRSQNVNPYKGRIYMFTIADGDLAINLLQTKRHVFLDSV